MKDKHTIVFACKTMFDEVNLAMRKTGCTWPIYWLEDNLHNFPDKLRRGMQTGLDELDGYKRVLMAFGLCGNAVIGLKTHSFSLVLPRVDDCISLMLGGMDRRVKEEAQKKRIYLTEGWLRSDANIWSEYQYTIKKYGKKTAKYVMDAMYGKYDALTLLDTGAYDLSTLEKKAEKIADAFDLMQETISGTTSMLEGLLMGPWKEEEFIILPPYSTFKEKDADLRLLEPR